MRLRRVGLASVITLASTIAVVTTPRAALADPAPSCGVPVGAGQQTTVTCAYTGGLQSFTYPAGVFSATFTVQGAKGGLGGGPGGFGGETVVTISQAPGTTLDVLVGGQATGSLGSSIGGYGGGGTSASSGGGGSYVATAGGITNPADLLLAAGGGGGAGNTANDVGGNSDGGIGGGVTGGDGSSVAPGVAGTGGSQTAGGTSISPSDAGGFEQGGSAAGEGGGGGGGYYGGAAGDHGTTDTPDCGGGGGGSGFVSTSSAIDQETATQTSGVSEYDGKVTITYEPANPTTVTVTLSPSPSHYGQVITETATVKPVPAGGTVSLGYDNAPVGAPVPITTAATATKSKPAGTASVQFPASVSAGKHQAGAFFSSFGDIEGGSGFKAFTVLPALLTEHLTEKLTSPRNGKLKVKVATSPVLSRATVTVYLVSAGRRHKLGSVTTAADGKQHRTFTEKPRAKLHVEVGTRATAATKAAFSSITAIKIRA
jgi:hypothetical protein